MLTLFSSDKSTFGKFVELYVLYVTVWIEQQNFGVSTVLLANVRPVY